MYNRFMSKVKLNNITKYFEESTALNDVSFNIKEGECLAVVGPSGSGKSTILRIIAGLLDPSSGEVFIDNKNMTYSKPKDRNLTFVFQNLALYPHLTVKQNIEFSIKKNMSKEKLTMHVETIANELDIFKHLNKRPHELSGGEQQRVALARSLATNADIILMDEPLASLDTSLKREITDLILRIKTEEKKTIIYVTHDHNEAMKLGDKILVLNGGEVEQFSDVSEVYSHPTNPFVAQFFGTHPMNVFKYHGKLCGVRREDIYIVEDGIKVQVIDVKTIGGDIFVSFTYKNQRLILLTRENNINIGDKINIQFKSLHEFQ